MATYIKIDSMFLLSYTMLMIRLCVAGLTQWPSNEKIEMEEDDLYSRRIYMQSQ